MRNKVIAGVLIVALLGGGGWWYARRSKSAAAAAGPTYIKTTVKRGDIRATISGTGPVASVNGVMVKSNQSGTVAQIMAQDGDRVKAGQVIMVLSNDNLMSSLKQAQIDQQNNQANLDNLQNPQATAVRAQDLKVQNARLTLQQRQQDVAHLTVKAPASGVVSAVKVLEGSDVANNALLFTIFDDSNPSFTVMVPQQAAAALKAGQKASVTFSGFGTVQGTVQQTGGAATPGTGNRDANVPVTIALPAMYGLRAGMVGQASMQADGINYVIQGNGTVDSDVVEVRAQVAATASKLLVKEGDRVATGDTLLQLTSDSLQIQLQQSQNDLKTQEQNLDYLTSPANDPSGQLRSLRNKLEASNITLASRQSDVNDLQVKAPVDGQISSLTPRIGDKITNNQNLFRVADYGAMQITISVDELDVAKAKVGQKASITLDALPGKTYTGTVSKINPEGNFKNDIATFDVTVLVDKPDGLMAGMNATVNITVEEKKSTLWLPAQAVKVQQGQAYVQVLENNQPVRKNVQVGLRTTQQAEITGGLNENEEVILTVVPAKTTSGFNLFNRGGQQSNTQQQGGTQQQGNRANFQGGGGFTGGNGGTGGTGGTRTPGR